MVVGCGKRRLGSQEASLFIFPLCNLLFFYLKQESTRARRCVCKGYRDNAGAKKLVLHTVDSCSILVTLMVPPKHH